MPQSHAGVAAYTLLSHLAKRAHGSLQLHADCSMVHIETCMQDHIGQFVQSQSLAEHLHLTGGKAVLQCHKSGQTLFEFVLWSMRHRLPDEGVGPQSFHHRNDLIADRTFHREVVLILLALSFVLLLRTNV